MTKADIVETIHTTTGLSEKDTTALMESVFAIMKTTFESGETISIEARKVLTFKPSNDLRQGINGASA